MGRRFQASHIFCLANQVTNYIRNEKVDPRVGAAEQPHPWLSHAPAQKPFHPPPPPHQVPRRGDALLPSSLVPTCQAHIPTQGPHLSHHSAQSKSTHVLTPGPLGGASVLCGHCFTFNIFVFRGWRPPRLILEVSAPPRAPGVDDSGGPGRGPQGAPTPVVSFCAQSTDRQVGSGGLQRWRLRTCSWQHLSCPSVHTLALFNSGLGESH